LEVKAGFLFLVVCDRILLVASKFTNLASIVVDPGILRAQPDGRLKFGHGSPIFTKASERERSSIVYESLDLFVPLSPTCIWRRNRF
jgi:hypothetical protein